MNLLAQISEIKKAADYAALQSDRWLFVAVLIVFFVAMYFTVRWGMAQLAARDKRIDELSKEFNDHLKGSVKDLSTVIAHNSEVIHANTNVIHANTEMSERKLSVLDRVERALPKLP